MLSGMLLAKKKWLQQQYGIGHIIDEINTVKSCPVLRDKLNAIGTRGIKSNYESLIKLGLITCSLNKK